MATSAESREIIIIRGATVKYLHAEIHSRYRLNNLKSIPDIERKKLLEGISQTDIDRLEALFLSTVYPEPDKRHDRDKSFESLIMMLKNPRALSHIIPSIPRIMLHHATQFPFALRIGLNSVLAFNLSYRLENQMVKNVTEICRRDCTEITDNFKLSAEIYRRAFVMAPYGDALRMIKLARWVMNAGSQGNIMDTAWDILNDVQSSLISKDEQREKADMSPEHSNDIMAIEYGKSVIDNIRSTFNDYPRETMMNMIEISWLTEFDYLERMYGNK